MNSSDHKANIPLDLQPCSRPGTASWAAEHTDRCRELFQQLAKKFLYQSSPAVVKHFRNSCDDSSFTVFHHPQVPGSGMDFPSQLGPVELPSTVKDDWIHYAPRSALKGICILVTLRPLRGQSVPGSSVELACLYSMWKLWE